MFLLAQTEAPQSFTETIRTSLQQTLTDMWTETVALIPNVAGMLVILLLGYLIAVVFRWVASTVLARVQFDAICEKTGLTEIMRSLGVEMSPSQIVGKLVFYGILLMFLVSAVDVLGMERVSQSISTLLGYIPSVIGALVILTFGLMLANFVRAMVRGAADRMGLEYAGAVGQLVYGLLIIVIGSLAVAQLQIETDLINRVIEISLMAAGAGLAIALGFGTRDTARNVVAGVYARESYPSGAKLTVGDSQGTVEAVHSVNTKIKTTDGKVIYVPNGQLMEMLIREEP